MQPEAWAFFSALSAAVTALLLEQMRTRRQITRVAERTPETPDDQDPQDIITTAGFRTAVLRGLGELQVGQAEQAARLDEHLDDHAAAILRSSRNAQHRRHRGA